MYSNRVNRMVRISDVLKRKLPEEREPKGGEEFFIQTTKGEKKVPTAESQQIYNQAIDLMKKILAESESSKREEVRRIVESLVRRLEENDRELINLTRTSSGENYLFAHSVNVCILAIKLGLALGYEYSKLIDLGIAALLHDLGMSRVMEIAKCPRKLTKDASLTVNPFWDIFIVGTHSLSMGCSNYQPFWISRR